MEELRESARGAEVMPGDFMPKAPAEQAIGMSAEMSEKLGHLDVDQPGRATKISQKFGRLVDDQPGLPGRANDTNAGASSSKRCGLSIHCKECLSDEGPGRMGPMRTPYAGSFYCKRCWDSIHAADPGHKGSSGYSPASKYNYEVVIPTCTTRKARLLERNEDRTWKIQYINHTTEDNIPENVLVPHTKDGVDTVDTIDELKTMLHATIADYPTGLKMVSLGHQINKRFSRRIDPKIFGHTKLVSLMRDDRLSGEFEEKDSIIYQLQPDCDLMLEQYLE